MTDTVPLPFVPRAHRTVSSFSRLSGLSEVLLFEEGEEEDDDVATLLGEGTPSATTTWATTGFPAAMQMHMQPFLVMEVGSSGSGSSTTTSTGGSSSDSDNEDEDDEDFVLGGGAFLGAAGKRGTRGGGVSKAMAAGPPPVASSSSFTDFSSGSSVSSTSTAGAAAGGILNNDGGALANAPRRAKRVRDAAVASMTPKAKEERRKARNRELAAESRVRRKNEMEALKHENATLRARIAQLERQVNGTAASGAGGGGGGAPFPLVSVAALGLCGLAVTPHGGVDGGVDSPVSSSLTASVLVAVMDALDRAYRLLDFPAAVTVALVLFLGWVLVLGLMSRSSQQLLAGWRSVVPSASSVSSSSSPVRATAASAVSAAFKKASAATQPLESYAAFSGVKGALRSL